MVDLLEVQTYLDHIKENMPAINIVRLVIDDTQINEIIKDIASSDNLMLLALVPSHLPLATNEDDYRNKDVMVFLVLKKADRKIKHTQFISNLHICQQAGRDIMIKLIEDMTEYNDGCSFLNQLQVPSLEMDPVYQLAGADGYEINFFMYSNL